MFKKILLLLSMSALMMSSPLAYSEGRLIPILNFVSGIFNQGVFPESDAFTTDDDIVITASDGISLSANIFVPTELNGLAPAIIFINSWAMTEYQYLEQAEDLAKEGYIVLSYASRGWGTSGGLVDTAGPKDVDDFSRVVDYLIANYPVDPSALGTAGISYGAGISLLGAAADDRISAVSAMSAWGDLGDALYGEKTPRRAWGEFLALLGDLLAKPDPILNQHWDDLKKQNLAAIPAILDWAAIRSPINYVDQLNANGAAIYLGKAYGDNLFQPNTVLDLFSQLTVPKHIDLLPGTHASAEVLPSLTGIGDNLMWNNTYQWFDLHLKGKQTDIASAKPVQMKVKFTDKLEGFDEFPIAEVQNTRYFLHPRKLFDSGDLETYEYSKWRSRKNSYHTQLDSLFTSGVPLFSELLGQLDVPVVASVPLSSPLNSLYYNSARLTETMQIRGTPSISVQVKPHADTIQVMAYLYDMSTSGLATLITHGAKTLPVAQKGKKQRLTFDMTTIAYNVPAGHKVVLALDSQDIEYEPTTKKGYVIDLEFQRGAQSDLIIPTL
jgi:predicted acyl esterase